MKAFLIGCTFAPFLVLATSGVAVGAAVEAPARINQPPVSRPGEIRLKATMPSPVKGGERWGRLGTGTIVRNVSQATLTPVLPPAGSSNGTAVIVAPGGGFMMLSMTSEGFDVADYLSSKGVTAFVLKYRLQPTPSEDSAAMAELFGRLGRPNGVDEIVKSGLPLASEDAQEAMRIVRKDALKWNIDPNKIGFMGFSAGAFTALALTYKNDPATRPDFIVSIYGPTWTPTESIPDNPPPMWASMAADDPLLLRASDFGLIKAWQAKGGSIEFHLYDKGGHGYGLAGTPKTTTVNWPQHLLSWLQSRGLYLAEGSSKQLPAKQ